MVRSEESIEMKNGEDFNIPEETEIVVVETGIEGEYERTSLESGPMTVLTDESRTCTR